MGKNDSLLISGGIILGTAVVEGMRRLIRRHGEKKRQKKVDESYVETKTVVKVNSGMELSVINKANLPANMSPTTLTVKESEEVKPFVLDCMGQVIKAATAGHAVDNLLVCNVPLSNLAEVKGDPGMLRGFVTKDGQIVEQAKFQKANLKQVAPMIAMQALAAATSQYYMQVITEQLEAINAKVDMIATYLEAEDKARLVDGYRKLSQFATRDTFLEFDIQSLEGICSTAFTVREKCRDMLNHVKLNSKSAATDYKEAKVLVDRFYQSKYLDYLELAKAAEILYYASNVVLIKASNSLNLDGKRIDDYMAALNPRFWDYYQKDFYQKQHNILEYIHLAEESAVLNKKKFKVLYAQVQTDIQNVEKQFVQAEEKCNQKVQIVLAIDKEGNVVKYEKKEN